MARWFNEVEYEGEQPMFLAGRIPHRLFTSLVQFDQALLCPSLARRRTTAAVCPSNSLPLLGVVWVKEIALFVKER
jgi:hypothetical protein